MSNTSIQEPQDLTRYFKKVRQLDLLPPPDPIHGDKPRLWTKSELADWTNCRTEFIDEEVFAGRLKAIKLSRQRIRYRWTDISAWLEAKTSEVAS